MNRLTHALMVVTMVLHGILGCCWHHGHAAACASEARRVVSPQVAPVHTGCCHHDHCRPQSPDSPGSGTSDEQNDVPAHHEHECSSAECVYVGSKAPELSHPIPFQAFLGETEVLLTEGPPRSSLEGSVEPPPPHFRSSLASCALLQVWRL